MASLPLTPISTTAHVQIDSCIPNFVLQEHTGEDRPPRSLMVKQPPRLTLPDPPGIGGEINDDFFASHSYTPSAVDIPPREDGSVALR